MTDYWQKLKDPRWQKKRLEVLQLKDFCCEICGDGESPLNVHHKEYFKGREPWDYENNQLAVICESCHKNFHSNIDILKWVCSQADLDGPNDRTNLAFILAGYMGIDYFELISISDCEDCSHFRKWYSIGIKSKEASYEMV